MMPWSMVRSALNWVSVAGITPFHWILIMIFGLVAYLKRCLWKIGKRLITPPACRRQTMRIWALGQDLSGEGTDFTKKSAQ
jgi:hypothetical protein